MVDFFLEAGWFQLHWHYDIVEVTEEINMLCMYTLYVGCLDLYFCVFSMDLGLGFKGISLEKVSFRFLRIQSTKRVWSLDGEVDILYHLGMSKTLSQIFWTINSMTSGFPLTHQFHQIWSFLRTVCFVSRLRMMSFDRTCNGIWHRNCSLEESSLRCQSRSDVTQHDIRSKKSWQTMPKI